MQICFRKCCPCIVDHPWCQLGIINYKLAIFSNQESFTLSHWIGTCCDNRLQLKFCATSFSRVIILFSGALFISMKCEWIRDWNTQWSILLSRHFYSLTFNSKRNFLIFKQSFIADFAFEFRVGSI
jgi:hypothetical protein